MDYNYTSENKFLYPPWITTIINHGIERYVVDKVVDHKTGRGRKGPHNYKYRLRLKGYGPESDLIYRADEVPQCHEMISVYRSRHGLETASGNQPNNWSGKEMREAEIRVLANAPGTKRKNNQMEARANAVKVRKLNGKVKGYGRQIHNSFQM